MTAALPTWPPGYRPPKEPRWRQVGPGALYRCDGVLIQCDPDGEVLLRVPGGPQQSAGLRENYKDVGEAMAAVDGLHPVPGHDLVPESPPEGWREESEDRWVRADGGALAFDQGHRRWGGCPPGSGSGPTLAASFPTLAVALGVFDTLFPRLCGAAHPTLEDCLCERLPHPPGEHLCVREVPGGAQVEVWESCGHPVGAGTCRLVRGHPGECSAERQAPPQGDVPLTIRRWQRDRSDGTAEAWQAEE